MSPSLIPRDRRFYTLFESQAARVVEAARELVTAFGDVGRMTEHQARIKDIEHAGDDLAHEVVNHLNHTFITPFDREDIRSLATDLDDVLDYVEGVAQQLINFDLDESPPELRQFAEILVSMTAEIEGVTERIWNLAKQREIQQSIVRISDLENQADDLYNKVIADLFRANGRDPLEIMKWKEIYDGLENACDQCKDYTHIVGNVIVKNA